LPFLIILDSGAFLHGNQDAILLLYVLSLLLYF